MPINILMPALSPTMEEGTLAKWLVKEGDKVASGAVIAEIETDKATMEFEAVDEGVIGKIVVPEGTEGVKVNDLIAVLLEEGESARRDRQGRRAETRGEAGRAQIRARVARRNATRAPPQHDRPDGDRIFASPLARRIAAEKGHRPRRHPGLRPERPHRQGRRRRRPADRQARRRRAAQARRRARPAGRRPRARRRGGQEALRRPRLRGDQARRDAPDDRRPADRGEADDPALLPAPRHPARRAARVPRAAQPGSSRPAASSSRSTTSSSRPRRSRCSRSPTATRSGPATGCCG